MDARPSFTRLGVERLNAFSDGVFAIASTLLVLELHAPEGLTAEALHTGLREDIPSLLTYLLSFMVVGIFWVRHHQLLSLARCVTPGLLTLNLLFLTLIALIPFPTSLLGNYSANPLAPAFYATVVGLACLANMALMIFIQRRPDVQRPGVPPALIRAHLLRPALSAAVVFASVPVAFLVSAAAAELTWLLLVPIRFLVSRDFHQSVQNVQEGQEERR